MCDGCLCRDQFLSADLPLFAALIDDLFPSVIIEPQVNAELQSAIERAAASSGLQPVPLFVNKVEQLYDTMTVRFGVMLVGETGSGKSACHSTLSAAMNWLHEQPSSAQSFSRVVTSSLNPKSISMDELYGSVSALTQEWSDGLASSIMRAAMADTDLTHQHWIHFDGPVDALWIENMVKPDSKSAHGLAHHTRKVTCRPHSLTLSRSASLLSCWWLVRTLCWTTT